MTRKRSAALLVIALTSVLLPGGSSAQDLADYRCAGAGTISARYAFAQADSGWKWSFSANGVCVFSPGGPYVFHANGFGYDGCTLNTSDSPNIVFSPMRVLYTLTNPRTGAQKQLIQAWHVDPVFGIATGPLNLLRVHDGRIPPSCSSTGIGPRTGSGALVRTPGSRIGGSSQNRKAAFTFVVQSV